MKANCQLRKKVGEQKAIELITEHGRCLIKKDKNTYRFLDGYVFDAEGNTTLNKNDKEQLLKNILEVVDNKNE